MSGVAKATMWDRQFLGCLQLGLEDPPKQYPRQNHPSISKPARTKNVSDRAQSPQQYRPRHSPFSYGKRFSIRMCRSKSIGQRSSMKVLRTVVRNVRSVCAVAVISLFVLFLTASAPHRVHHLFENLSHSAKVLEQQAFHDPADIHPLAVSKLDTGARKHAHQVHHPTKNGHDRRGHKHHYGHFSSADNHKYSHGDWHDRKPEYPIGRASPDHGDTPLSGIPLSANPPRDDGHHDTSAQTVCLLQSAAQHSHIARAQLVPIPFFRPESQERTDHSLLGFSTFNPSPFSQRAPPKV